MNTKLIITFSLVLSAAFGSAQAQSVKPDTIIIYVVPESDTGLSAKKTFLGKAVYNQEKKKIGTITDLIIAPDTSLAYVVIGAGGFVGLGRHNVDCSDERAAFRGWQVCLAGRRHQGEPEGGSKIGGDQRRRVD